MRAVIMMGSNNVRMMKDFFFTRVVYSRAMMRDMLLLIVVAKLFRVIRCAASKYLLLPLSA